LGRGVSRIVRSKRLTPLPPPFGRRPPPQGGRWRAVPVAQLQQRRQKSREGLAGTGGRNQQSRAVIARLGKQRELMLARRPATRGEPFPETLRQQRRRRGRCLCPGKEVRRRHEARGKPSSRLRRGFRQAESLFLILRSVPRRASRRMQATGGASWFETALTRLLTMWVFDYSVTGLSEMSQSLPLKIEM
jgi:hypothetical protein